MANDRKKLQFLEILKFLSESDGRQIRVRLNTTDGTVLIVHPSGDLRSTLPYTTVTITGTDEAVEFDSVYLGYSKNDLIRGYAQANASSADLLKFAAIEFGKVNTIPPQLTRRAEAYMDGLPPTYWEGWTYSGFGLNLHGHSLCTFVSGFESIFGSECVGAALLLLNEYKPAKTNSFGFWVPATKGSIEKRKSIILNIAARL